MFPAVRPLARGSSDPLLRVFGGRRRAAGGSGEITLFGRLCVVGVVFAHFYDMLLYFGCHGLFLATAVLAEGGLMDLQRPHAPPTH